MCCCSALLQCSLPFLFARRLSLNIMTLNVQSPKVFTNQGVAILVTGVAQVCCRLPVLLWLCARVVVCVTCR